MTNVTIALGANVPGAWGPPEKSVRRALLELRARGIHVKAVSRLYSTKPHAALIQPDYINAVVSATTSLPPRAVLNALKQLERAAGRSRGRLNGPRPLDLDIVDYAGQVAGWPVRRRDRGGLVLPHPLAHLRAFVLRPLLDVAPRWRHPVLRTTGRALLRRLPDRAAMRDLPA